MIKKIIIAYAIALSLAGASSVYAANNTFSNNFLPLANDRYDLGTTTPANEWLHLFVKDIVVSGTCTGCGGGGGSNAWPFTPLSYNGVANQSTTTPLWLKNAMIIASSTFFTQASTTALTNTGNTWLTLLGTPAGAFLAVDPNGKVIATTTPTGGGGSTSPGGSDTQVQFNDVGSFAGSDRFVWDESGQVLKIGSSTVDNQQMAIRPNGAFQVEGQAPFIDFANGSDGIMLSFDSSPADTDNGGNIVLTANTGGPTSGAGGSISLTAGNAQAGDSNGGSVSINAGNGSGAGMDGLLHLQGGGGSFDGSQGSVSIGASLGILLDTNSGYISFTNSDGPFAKMDTSLLSTERIFQFPDGAGTFCILELANCTSGGGSGFSTTSAQYFLSVNQGPAFSTSSASYFLSQNQGPAFSTTSAAFFLSLNQGNAFSTSSASNFLNLNRDWKVVNATYLTPSTTPLGIIVTASSTIASLHLGTALEVQSGGTASTTLGGILTGNGTGAVTSATVSSPLTFLSNTLACATCVVNTRTINTTFPLQGGGALSSDLTITNAFGTTTNTGLTANRFVYTSPSGILLTVASSGLALPNSALTNSTISGVALGSNLNAHTVSGTLTGTSYNGSASVSDWAINLANANTWTGRQNFSNASSTLFTCTTCYIGTIGNALNGGAFQINNIADPTSAQDAATKMYVDNAVQGTDAKDAVKFATTAALPAVVYANGSSGVGATLTGVAFGAISLDSGSPIVGDRLLIKNQVSTFQNGIYTVTIVGTVGTVFVLTRSTDFDIAADIDLGDTVFVTSGTLLALTTWEQNGTNAPVMGTDPITFAQIAGPGAITATYPITISGTTISTAFLFSTLFDKNTNFGGAVISTTTPIFLLNGIQASSTSQFANASTTNVSASGVGYFGTASTTNLVVSGIRNSLLFAGASGAVTGTTTLSVAFGGTGSTTLGGILSGNGSGGVKSVLIGSNLTYDGTTLSAIASGGTAADPFTHGSVYGQTTSATSTLLALTGTPFSLVASGTVAMVNASTTNFTVFGNEYWPNSPNILLSTNASGMVSATTTPTFASFNGTSTTATSTLQGSLTVGAGMTYPYLDVGTTSATYGYLSELGLNVHTQGTNDFFGGGFYNGGRGPCDTATVDTLNFLSNTGGHFTEMGQTGSAFTGIGCPFTAYTGFGADNGYFLNPNGRINNASITGFKWFVGGQTATNEVAGIDAMGDFGLGTTSPWAAFSLMATTSQINTRPILVIATSTNAYGLLEYGTATTSVLVSLQNPRNFVLDSGVRWAFGTSQTYDYPGLLDQLTVNGRVNTGDWHYVECAGISATGNTDTANACGQFSFQQDTGGGINVTSGGNGINNNCIGTGNSCVTNTAVVTGAGVGLFYPNTSSAQFVLGTTTPVMEAVARINTPANATSSQFYIGFSNVDPTGISFEIEPTAGCYFAATSSIATGNWLAIARSTAALNTRVDTGFASSSNVTATGGYYRFRIESDQNGCRFYMASSTAALRLVANISTNLPTATALNSGVWLAQTAAGFGKTLNIAYIKLWFNQPALNYSQ